MAVRLAEENDGEDDQEIEPLTVGMTSKTWYGMVWYGMVWYGIVW
jgi:hypothetical protein